MNERYIPAFIMLLAGTITCISSLVNKFDVLYSLKVLLVVLVVFYVIGLIAQRIVYKINRAVLQQQRNMEEDELLEDQNVENEQGEDFNEIK